MDQNIIIHTDSRSHFKISIMLFEIEYNGSGSGFLTIDTEHLNYEALCTKLDMKKDWQIRAVKRVITSFDKTHPDLKDNGHYKTRALLVGESRESVFEKLIEAEVLKRNLKFINKVQHPVYGLNPKKLYEAFAQEEIFSPGAVGVVDERYGEPFHTKSNELMFKETELLRYLQIRGIPFYPMIQAHTSREEVAQLYDEQVRSLHALFPQSVALLGIGTDAHTAGIAPNTSSFKNPVFSQEQKYAFVSSFTDPKRFYGQRVTMTFLGLAMIDVLVLLVFGDDKNEALDAMFREGSEEEIPSRFYKRPEIAVKTLLITDSMLI